MQVELFQGRFQQGIVPDPVAPTLAQPTLPLYNQSYCTVDTPSSCCVLLLVPFAAPSLLLDAVIAVLAVLAAQYAALLGRSGSQSVCSFGLSALVCHRFLA
jgi:hypothetical protein